MMGNLVACRNRRTKANDRPDDPGLHNIYGNTIKSFRYLFNVLVDESTLRS